MYVLRPIRLLSLTALSAFCAWGVTPLPVVFEQGLRPGEFLARVGSSAVVVRSTGVQFEAEVDLLMVGARVVAGEALGRLPGTSNYFQGSDRAKWRPGVPHFGRVVFHDVYPDIDRLILCVVDAGHIVASDQDVLADLVRVGKQCRKLAAEGFHFFVESTVHARIF